MDREQEFYKDQPRESNRFKANNQNPIKMDDIQL